MFMSAQAGLVHIHARRIAQPPSVMTPLCQDSCRL